MMISLKETGIFKLPCEFKDRLSSFLVNSIDKQKTVELINLRDELKELWMEYVKLEGEVPLGGAYLTMWDGSGERMDKMFYRDGEVFIKDVFGNEYDFKSDTDFESLVDLYDIILTKQSFEEYE